MTDSSTTHLLLLPHAGGDPATFATWLDRFPDDIRPTAPTVPGRPASVRAAATSVCARLPADGSVALFGHSFGAAVAAESAQILLRSRRRPLLWLGLSGWTGPVGDAHTSPTHLSDEDLLVELEKLDGVAPHILWSTEFRSRRLPSIRAQWRALEDYEGRADLGSLPVTWMRGAQDTHLRPSSGPVISSRSESSVHPGSHFYLFEDPARVITAIVSAIRAAREHLLDPQEVLIHVN